MRKEVTNLVDIVVGRFVNMIGQISGGIVNRWRVVVGRRR